MRLKGKLAVTIGLGRSEYQPFLNAGLPIKEVPTPKEGLPASSGYGVLGIVKNPPHPNAMKVFVNWFLGKEGQEFYAKVMKQGTRRLDVDTKWMSQIGVDAAKDVMTLADYHRLRNSFRGQSHQSSQAGGRVCRKDQQMSLRSEHIENEIVSILVSRHGFHSSDFTKASQRRFPNAKRIFLDRPSSKSVDFVDRFLIRLASR